MGEESITNRIVNARHKIGSALQTDDLGLAKNYVQKGIRELSDIIREHPENLAAVFERGRAYDRLRRYNDALPDFDRAIELHPQNAELYNRRGNVKIMLRDIDGANADYLKAYGLKKNPKYLTNIGITIMAKVREKIAQNIANTWEKKTSKMVEDAIKLYTKAIETDPYNWVPFLNRGNAYEMIHEYDTAIRDFTRAIELGAGATAYIARAEVHRLNNDYFEAFEDADSAVGLEPKNPDAYRAMGYAAEKRGFTDMANANFRREEELRTEQQRRAEFLRG
jgi:tetratricopeptide (TPR) repeat protein